MGLLAFPEMVGVWLFCLAPFKNQVCFPLRVKVHSALCFHGSPPFSGSGKAIHVSNCFLLGWREPVVLFRKGTSWDVKSWIFSGPSSATNGVTGEAGSLKGQHPSIHWRSLM